MKLPDNFLKQESSHKTDALNTMTLTGISVLWGVMLQLISPWWMALSVLLLLSGYGSEVDRRQSKSVKL